MGANTPAREATVAELSSFRSNNQWSRIHLAIQPAVTVYTARVNQTFENYDGVYEIKYIGGEGVLAEIVPNMLLLIGSSAGAHDHGICRIRKAADDVKFYIGLTSGIRPEDEDYLTVIDMMPLCAKHPTGSGTSVRMDYEVEYSAAADAPIPVLGPLAAVLRLTGDTVEFTPPDPSDLSWSPVGAAITDYLFDAPGASATADMDTTQPTFTYDTAGWYRWSCTITDENDVSSTGYRWLVVEPESPQFSLQSCEGSVDDGGWSFEVRALSGVDLDTVRDRAMCVLWTEDWYDNQKGSIGPIEGYENILAVGWIRGETINHNPLNEALEFTVSGPAWWLSQLQAFPFLAADTSSTPTGWLQIEEATIDKGLSRILHWGSNASQILDCVVTGDTNRAATLSAPDDNLLGQLDTLAERVFARCLCNRFGQLFVEKDAQYMTSTQRNALPVVHEITSEDWRETLEIERMTVLACSMMEISAAESYNGSKEIFVHSRASGNIPLDYGAPESHDNFVVEDQDECNRMSGAALAAENNEYPEIPVNFACNERLIDICPGQFCTLTVAEGDTVRGIAFSDKRLIPRRIKLDLSAMKLRHEVEFEGEATGEDGITYYPPTPIYGNVEIPDIDTDIDFPGPDVTFPPYVPTPPDTEDDCTTSTTAPTNGYSIVFDKTSISSVEEDRVAYAYYPCYMRMSTAQSPTKLLLIGNFSGDAKDHLHVYAVKGGVRVLEATTQFGTMGGYATFAPVIATLVDGFEIELDVSPEVFVPGDVVDTGTVNANNASGVAIAVTPGNWYAVEGAGGPWLYQASAPEYEFYNFALSKDGVNWSTRADSQGIGFSASANPPNGEMRLDLGSVITYAEAIDGQYGRAYIQASGASIYFCVSDSLFGDNDGSLDYVLRNAIAAPRFVALGSATILNVCGV